MQTEFAGTREHPYTEQADRTRGFVRATQQAAARMRFGSITKTAKPFSWRESLEDAGASWNRRCRRAVISMPAADRPRRRCATVRRRFYFFFRVAGLRLVVFFAVVFFAADFVFALVALFAMLPS
jgi:hypothetical protein